VLSSINDTKSDGRLGKVVTKVGMGGKVKDEGDVDDVLELRDDSIENKAGLRLETGMGKLPAVVFTHGMAGMSQSYSHYLGSIASHGYVVAAIEHRDGSGPGTIVHYPDGGERFVWHLSLDDLE
jgi:predicted dienelactone hydrolase